MMTFADKKDFVKNAFFEMKGYQPTSCTYRSIATTANITTSLLPKDGVLYAIEFICINGSAATGTRQIYGRMMNVDGDQQGELFLSTDFGDLSPSSNIFLCSEITFDTISTIFNLFEIK